MTSIDHNSKVARSTSTSFAGRGTEMEAFDRLPLSIRDALNEYNIKMLAATVLPFLSLGEHTILASMRDAETNDIRHYSREFERKYGYPFPHTAARATIMRYGAKYGRRAHSSAPYNNTQVPRAGPITVRRVKNTAVYRRMLTQYRNALDAAESVEDR